MKLTVPYKFLLFLIIIIGTWSCERDDICSDSTPTTPHLIILFYDVDNPEDPKAVRQLTVRGLDSDGNYLDDIPLTNPLDSISLPLRIQTGATTSRFELEKDSDFFDNGDPLTDSNKDIITVTYTPEFRYVSQACGYKSIFTNLSVNIEQDGENWIRTNEILTTTIENETQAHIILRH